jgi:hypothetical protein
VQEGATGSDDVTMEAAGARVEVERRDVTPPPQTGAAKVERQAFPAGVEGVQVKRFGGPIGDDVVARL